MQEEIGLGVTRIATQRAKTLRRTLTSMLYNNERSLLLHSLLEWAKHDKHCLVSEPRHNQMRWRTHHEWQALKLGNIALGDHDGAERAGMRVYAALPCACFRSHARRSLAAYYKFSFLFSGYSVRAWYWCVSGTLHALPLAFCLTHRVL